MSRRESDRRGSRDPSTLPNRTAPQSRSHVSFRRTIRALSGDGYRGGRFARAFEPETTLPTNAQSTSANNEYPLRPSCESITRVCERSLPVDSPSTRASPDESSLSRTGVPSSSRARNDVL